MNLKQAINYLFQNNKVLFSFLLLLLVIPVCNAQTDNNTNSEELAKGGVLQAVVKPVNPQDKEKDTKFIYEVAAGTTIEDQFWLANVSDKENIIRIYPTYETDENKFSFEQDEIKEIAQWINLPVFDYTLTPNEQKKVDFTLEVPSDIENGTYKGGFAVSKIMPEVKSGVRSAFRIIIPIQVTVTDNPKEFTYTKDQVTFQPTAIFYGAVILFVLTVIYFLSSWLRNKKPQ